MTSIALVLPEPQGKYLKDNKKTVVTGDWGLATPLMLLTEGKRNINELAFQANSLSKDELYPVMKKLASNCSYFILYTAEYTKLLRARDMIKLFLERDGAYKKDIIYNKNNRQFIEVYSCKDLYKR